MELRPDQVAVPNAEPSPPRPPRALGRAVSRPQVEALAPARYKVQFTASAELRAKLDRLQSLMRTSVPDGDLAAILEEAVTEKLERLEARRNAKARSPRKSVEESDTSAGSRYVPAAIKRTVRERDEERCTFLASNGKRCPETERLEIHHDDPFAKGGDRSPENLRLLCRAHNRLLAERDYGKKVMTRYRRGTSANPSAAREPSPVLAVGPANLVQTEFTAGRPSSRRFRLELRHAEHCDCQAAVRSPSVG